MKKRTLPLLSGRLIVVLTILLITHQTLQAQQFHEGYIITQKPDTIHGLIKDSGGSKAAKACLFKASEGEKSQTFLPGEIKGYRLNNGKYYISREVNGRVVFLEYLVSGKARLYYLSDREGQHYFIETDKSGLVELSAAPRIIETDTGTYQLPDLYRGKLVYALGDYKPIAERVREVELSHSSLISLAKDYHDYVCDSVACVVFRKKVKPLRVSVVMVAGAGFNRLKFGSKVVTDWSTGPEVGLYTDLYNLIVSNERYWFRFGLLFSYHNTYDLTMVGQSEDYAPIEYNRVNYTLVDDRYKIYPGSSGYVTGLSADLQMLTLKVPITINYMYGEDSGQPYLGIGMTNYFILNSNRSFKYLEYADTYRDYMPNYLMALRFHTGIAHELGNNYRIIFDLSYEHGFTLVGLHTFERLSLNEFAVKVGLGF